MRTGGARQEKVSSAMTTTPAITTYYKLPSSEKAILATGVGNALLPVLMDLPSIYSATVVNSQSQDRCEYLLRRDQIDR
jgi:hypothetical protein